MYENKYESLNTYQHFIGSIFLSQKFTLFFINSKLISNMRLFNYTT